MTNLNDYIQMNIAMNTLRGPVLQQAVQALDLPPGSSGLDVGCGLGFQTLLLAEAVGPAGRITGLDLSADYIEYALQAVDKAGLSDRIDFRQGEVRKLPFDDNIFDWAWSVDLLGYAPMDPIPLLKELRRAVKPGGKIALLAWTSELLLPGYPELEAHLGATTAGIAPFIKGNQPRMHFTRALGWFRQLNFKEISAHTFAGGAYAPLTERQRSALAALINMRWPGVVSELNLGDWVEYQRLCLPDSPDYILDQPDYYAHFTYTMFQGRVSE